ncbi:MAG: ATP-binding protein [Bacteroidales bacterium]|nr:ATP-binding protein [Bacteroidales bacterium]
MILQNTIEQVVDEWQDRFSTEEAGIAREKAIPLNSIASHATVISGIRRCGKSTLLVQFYCQLSEPALFVNFEHPLLMDFTTADYARLDNIIRKRNAQWLLFDEIQSLPNWELYVRQKLDQHYKVVITGSNASLLSRELGTHLTGRHISMELFPFSYSEFLKLKSQTASYESFREYLFAGGFPEYLKTGDTQQLSTLFQDILYRDIVVRYGIKEVSSLQRLVNFLLQNIGNKFSASKIKQIISVNATNTILNWCNYLANSYLFAFVEKYSSSVRSQMVSPKKIYSADTGLAYSLSTHSMTDEGHLLENLVYIALRNHFLQICYFEGKGECDFVVLENGTPSQLYQVCLELNPDNMHRETSGLEEAMRMFSIHNGFIITENQTDTIQTDMGIIEVLPFWKFF